MSGPIPSRQPSFTSPPATPSPRRPSALAGGTSADQRRARREQFRSFYGLKGGPSDDSNAQSSTAGRGRVTAQEEFGDRLNIDSTGFDAAAYYEDLIKKSSLAELMQAAAGMSADINNLQSSRHSLVYNHHHQLFAAGDTISHLNSRTPQLLSIMTSLQDSFSSISQLVDSVALPSEQSISDTEDGERIALSEGLERVRLMIIADQAPNAIRRLWEDLKVPEGVDYRLRQEYEGIQRTVEALPEPTPPADQLSVET